MPPETTCGAHHDALVGDVRDLLITTTDIKADLRNWMYESGQHEKSMTKTLDEIRAELKTMRDADIARDLLIAKDHVKTNLFWRILVDKGGWVAILAGALIGLKGCI